MRAVVTALTLLVPLTAWAAGSGSDAPPKPTQTTQECSEGQVWDTKTSACVDAESSSLDDDTRYAAVRELAYAGRYSASLDVLATMQDRTDSRVLTYLGFNNRKLGRVEIGMAYYAQALAADPDNHLARSYMGQALVEAGDFDAARVQLAEIRSRGGAGWPEQALAEAIDTGHTFAY